MSKASATSFIVLCAALAACSDNSSTTRAVTAPDARPSSSEAPGDAGVAYTLDAASDAGFASEAAEAQLAGAQVLGAQVAAASPRAASGSRASGHVALSSGVSAAGIANEKYSFVALGTDPATPLAAKGQFEVMYTSVTGVEIKMHGDVTCMITFGNTARAAGPISKVWRNGVQIPVTANTHAFWVVVDNGEGQPSPDQVSLVRFSNAAIAQTFCATGFASVVYPNQEGNVQVRP